MSEKRFTEYDLENHARLIRIEERLEVLTNEICGFKKNFWRIFTPSLTFVTTAVSGVIAAVTTKLFHHH